MSSQLEVFVFRENKAAPTAVEFLTVRQNSTWGIPTAEFPGGKFVNEASPLIEPNFYEAEASNDIAERFENDHLWVCYGGLQGILEFKRNGSPAALAKLGNRLGIDSQDCPRGTFHSAEWAIVVEKPDAMEQGLGEEIEQRLVQSGLQKLAVTKPQELSLSEIEELWVPPYKWEKPQPAGEWWYATVDYMLSGPSRAYLLHGEDATEKVKAVKADLRREYGKDPHKEDERPLAERVRSLMHCTDRTEELVRNAALFWEPNDLLRMIAQAQAVATW